MRYFLEGLDLRFVALASCAGSRVPEGAAVVERPGLGASRFQSGPHRTCCAPVPSESCFRPRPSPDGGSRPASSRSLARRDTHMRRTLLTVFSLAITISIVGCSQKQASESTAGSDSLLASNPVEQPAGDITPQSQYNQPQTNPEPAASAPSQSPASSTPRTTT